jgi:ferric-dicitrate binding protein FerR (iron transport regulator)
MDTDFRQDEIDSLIFDKDVAYHDFLERVRGKKRRMLIRNVVVAAVCAASLAFLLILRYNYGGDKVDRLTELALATMQTPERGSEIQVILSDQTRYKVSEKEANLKYAEKGQLALNSTKEIVQESVSGDTKEILYNQVVVPWGKKSSITFADGTKLWLNAGSRAVYPVEFEENRREVFIEGEACFEVAKDVKRPFVVKTGTIDVTVLGTTFNVSAYPAEDHITVALVSGLVEVGKGDKNTPLLPNHAFTYNRQTMQQDVHSVNVYDYVCWKDGFLKFDSETLDNVLHQIEKYYAMEVVTNESFERYRITGKLDMKECVEDVMRIIADMAQVHYEIENNKIFISH